MLLFLLFKRAKFFELLKIQGTGKSCNFCDRNIKLKNKTIIKDFLLYIKFLIQYTDDNVPEKRLVVTLFIIYIVKRNIIIDITNIESFFY